MEQDGGLRGGGARSSMRLREDEGAAAATLSGSWQVRTMGGVRPSPLSMATADGSAAVATTATSAAVMWAAIAE